LSSSFFSISLDDGLAIGWSRHRSILLQTLHRQTRPGSVY
jgi:hypothetical protein